MSFDIEKIKKRSIELMESIQRIEKNRSKNGVTLFEVSSLASRGANLIQSVVGPKSPYVENLRNAHKQKSCTAQYLIIIGVLQAFHFDLNSGNLANLRQEIEAVVVSEILAQARKLMKTKGIHPAAAVIVACAGLEEFLRNWCEVKEIAIPEKQRSIGKFAEKLRAAGQIALPIERRIASWADYRNDAAHGSKWESITAEIANRTIREIEDFILEHREVLG